MDNKILLDWIESHKEDMIDFLKDYIRYRSLTGEEEEVQKEFIKPFFENETDCEELEVVDVSDEGDRPNINAVFKGSGGGKNLLFNGHSDVVDASEEEKWNVDPWEPVLKDGKLYGRGSNDMKGGNTAIIWAIKAIRESDIELSGDVMVSLVVGEEVGDSELGSIAATKALQQKGLDIPFCVNAEPTSTEIHTKSAGTFDFTIEVPGKEIHTSQKNLTQYPQRFDIPVGDEVGVDAIPIMTELLQELEKLEDEWNLRYRDKIFGGGGYPSPDMQGVGPIAICCTIIEAGGNITSIAGSAKIKGQIYYTPGVDEDKLWKEMKETAEKLSVTHDWLKENPIEMKCKESFHWPPFDVPLDHPGCEALGKSVQKVTGREPVFSGFKAVDDCTHIKEECGVDAVSIGPGDLFMGTHGTNEYVPIEQLVEATKIYAQLILDWCE